MFTFKSAERYLCVLMLCTCIKTRTRLPSQEKRERKVSCKRREKLGTGAEYPTKVRARFGDAIDYDCRGTVGQRT